MKYMALFLYLPLGNLITGGSLTKIAYYSTVPYRKVLYNKDQKTVDSEVYAELILNNQIQRQFVSEQFFLLICQGQEVNPKYEVSQGDRLHFVKFETKYIEACLDFLQQNLVASADVMKEKKIKVTGGGAYKYADLLQEKLGLT